MFYKSGFSLALAFGIAAFATPLSLSVARAAENPQPDAQIVMYTTKTCGYCAKARAWFSERKLHWDERDIEASPEAHAQWKSYGGTGTPLILINGKRLVGFSPTAIEAELADVAKLR